MRPTPSTFGQELSPGRAAIVRDIRARAAQRRRRLVALSRATAVLGGVCLAAGVAPGLLQVDIGAWASHLNLTAAGLLALSIIAASRAHDLARRTPA